MYLYLLCLSYLSLFILRIYFSSYIFSSLIDARLGLCVFPITYFNAIFKILFFLLCICILFIYLIDLHLFYVFIVKAIFLSRIGARSAFVSCQNYFLITYFNGIFKPLTPIYLSLQNFVQLLLIIVPHLTPSLSLTVDLVTLDDLSAEAMLESSQRVEMLAETFRRRQEALSDPGPPLPLPPKVRKENLCLQLLGLWM